MLRTTLIALISLGGLGCGSSQLAGLRSATPSDAAPAKKWQFVRLPLDLVDPAFVAATGFIRDHRVEPGFAYGYLPDGSVAKLDQSTQGQVAIIDPVWFAHNDGDVDVTNASASTATGLNKAAEAYHTYATLTDELNRMAGTHPNLIQLSSAGRSVSGRELWMVEVSSDVATEADKPELLYVSSMHGDEVAGKELLVYFLRQIVAEYGQNPRITNLVDHARLFIIPSMNPDGTELQQRFNARGVDLNRDFPDFTSDPNDTLTGRAPETQALMRLMSAHHFVLALNFHGGSVCFNMPWDTQVNSNPATKFADDLLIRTLGREYSNANVTMRSNSSGSFDRGLTYGYEWYEVDGGMQDFAIRYRQSTHATIELSQAKWPAASDLPRIWNENREALQRYFERGLEGLFFQVVDSTGQPVHNVAVSTADSRRSIVYPDGRVARPLIATTDVANQGHDVLISAPGFRSVTTRLSHDVFSGDYPSVTLSVP